MKRSFAKKRFFLRSLLCGLLIAFVFAICGCADADSFTATESDLIPTDNQLDVSEKLIYGHQIFFCYNGVLYQQSPSYGDVYTELPEGYVCVGETVNVGTIFDLGEMESNESGTLYRKEGSSDVMIFSFPGNLYEDGRCRYLLCVPVK